MGENYALLEQLAYSLASTGSNLHQQSTIAIQNASEAIQSKINELNQESVATLAKCAKLYEIIAQPLMELVGYGGDEQEDTVPDLVALLEEVLANADEKIESLHEQWQSCVRAEQEAWKRLTDGEDGKDGPRQEPDLQDLVGAMERAVADGEAEINYIEAEYAEYIQIESLKVMQTLMEG
ncbi:hypothetical protein IF1G_06410 [Cordyceps javanica]|uniref:Uncharacterized protein n=1 Tax=Cordyceps javanica TaxID=43265 RepID=A0A545V151_9HYPO|nr:hypothetical protein IF1G_06410 [Cordyceps javanica]TQW02567.1 hypothetical protein IF2G_09958 [Cordyceps javanica]